MLRHLGLFVAVACLAILLSVPAQASILTFEVFDPSLRDTPADDGPFEDPGVLPYMPGYGYPEGFRIPESYGDNITGSQSPVIPGEDDIIFKYGVGAEGFTPNVQVAYGPFSIFTGGPELWREGYGDLNGVLYQGSRPNANNIGNDYDILDVVLFGEAGFDVVLYSFDIASLFTDRTIDSVTVYDGVPFPFLTPVNQEFEDTSVVVPGNSHLTYDFEALLGGPIQSPVIWIRINANNLGTDSENIAIDNIRFGQAASKNAGVDPEDIENVLAQVPEPASLMTWLLGGSFAAAAFARRRKNVAVA